MRKWRQLKQNLTRKEVKTLLGEPLGMNVGGHLGEAGGRATGATLGPPLEVWTYSYERPDHASGRIVGLAGFSLTDGVLVGWVEPEWTSVDPNPPSGEP
jgi:hypothetical protein